MKSSSTRRRKKYSKRDRFSVRRLMTESASEDEPGCSFFGIAMTIPFVSHYTRSSGRQESNLLRQSFSGVEHARMPTTNRIWLGLRRLDTPAWRFRRSFGRTPGRQTVGKHSDIFHRYHMAQLATVGRCATVKKCLTTCI